MMHDIIRADNGGELIVWIVLAVIWTIVQTLSKARRPKQAPRPPAVPRRTEQRSVEDDLRELFERLSGEAERRESREQPQQQEPAAARARPMRPIRYQAEGPAQRRPSPPPIPTPTVAYQPPRPVRMPPKHRELHREEEFVQRIREVQAEPIQDIMALSPAEVEEKISPIEMSIDAEAMPQYHAQRTPLATSLNLRQLRMPSLSSRMAKRAHPEVSKLFGHPSSLRRAVISQIVIGPPKAFE